MSEIIHQNYSLRLNSSLLLLLAMIVIPGFVWWWSIGDLGIYIEYETPPGQVFYIISRLAGMYAVFILWLQVILALFKRTPFGEKLTFWNVRFHRNLGVTAFFLVLLHAVLFAAAVSIRKGHLAFGIFLPNFGEGYYALAVTLGVIALYGLVIVIIAGYLRKRGIQKAKWLHRLSVVIFVLAQAHCLLIGTETRYYIMIVVYAFMVATLFVAIYFRGFKHKVQRLAGS